VRKKVNMNMYGVLTTPDEFEQRDDRSYETLKEEGVYDLKLIFRGWYRKSFSMGLICYFETADGNRFKLFCFRHTRNGEDKYSPKQCEVDFEKVEDETWWRCTVKKNEKGKYAWVDAEAIG
jgi:hypothetical protein